MTVAESRGAAEVRQDIAREREQLAVAVDRLRTELGGTLNLRRRVGVLVPAAFATAFVVSGGIGATMRYFARRGRER
jgi:hypothetical protein